MVTYEGAEEAEWAADPMQANATDSAHNSKYKLHRAK